MGAARLLGNYESEGIKTDTSDRAGVCDQDVAGGAYAYAKKRKEAAAAAAAAAAQSDAQAASHCDGEPKHFLEVKEEGRASTFLIEEQGAEAAALSSKLRGRQSHFSTGDGPTWTRPGYFAATCPKEVKGLESQVILKIATQETAKFWTVPAVPNISLHSCPAYHAQLPENVRMLDFDAITTTSRNSLPIFHTDFRLRAAVSGHYDLRDSLEVDSLVKKLNAGGLKDYHPSYDQTVEILLVLGLPPGVVLHSAPQLIVSRRQDPVLNHGWEQMMRLHAVGWKRKSPTDQSASTTIMFAPAIRIRYLGENAGQQLRFDILTHVPKSFLENLGIRPAPPQKAPSPRLPETSSSNAPAAQTCCDHLVREKYSTWAMASLESACTDGWRLLGDGVECHLCEIVQGTAAPPLHGSALSSCYTRTWSNYGGDDTSPAPQLLIRAQVFQRQADLSYVRVRVQLNSGKNKLERAEACSSDGSVSPQQPPSLSPQLPRQPLASRPQDHDTRQDGRSCVQKHAALLVAWETKERQELQQRIHELTNQSYQQRDHRTLHRTRFDCWLRAWRQQALLLFGQFATLETHNTRVRTLDSVSFAALFGRCGNLRDPAPSSAATSEQHHDLSYKISRDMAEQIVKEVLFSKVVCAYHVSNVIANNEIQVVLSTLNSLYAI